jgi:threonine-phosphate decarboxylase
LQYFEHGGNPSIHPGIRYDFSQNINPLGMPEPVREAVCRSADEAPFYPDPACTALRALLSERKGISPENILCGNGASDLIFRVCACLCPKNVLIPEPNFSEYERSVRVFGGSVTEYRTKKENGFLPDEEILRMMTPETKLLFLGHPNNPTGRLIPEQLLKKILERSESLGIPVLIDECFLDFTDGNSALPLLASFPRLMILNAFTKLYGMAGIRLGYLAGEKKLLQKIGEFGPPWNVSCTAQKAGAAALLCEPAWTEQTRLVTRKERQFLSEALAGLGLTVYPSDADFLLTESRIPLFAPLAEKGILVRDCENFPGLDGHFIRIGIKMHDQNVHLLSAVRSVLKEKAWQT